MEGSSANNNMDNVEVIFEDIKNRRNDMLGALATDIDRRFRRQFDPNNESTWCELGYRDEEWKAEFKIKIKKLDPEHPESDDESDINFVRDKMEEHEWVSVVANISDAWLLAVAFFMGSQRKFHAADRARLYAMINEVPTMSDEIDDLTGKPPTVQQKKESKASSQSQVTAKPRSKRGRPRKEPKNSKESKARVILEPKKEEEEDKVCKACGQKESWVSCSNCEKWLHRTCANNISSSASSQDKYACLSCTRPPKKRKQT